MEKTTKQIALRVPVDVWERYKDISDTFGQNTSIVSALDFLGRLNEQKKGTSIIAGPVTAIMVGDAQRAINAQQG